MVGEQNMHVFVQDRGINPAFIFDPHYKSDPDNNVRHWAWAFAVGYNVRWLVGICINDIREVQTGSGGIPFRDLHVNVNTSDLYMGRAAAMMGDSFRTGGFSELPALLRQWQLLSGGR
jgi:hypothetical protein